ncbi:MAG: CinA family protein [Actinobacteria bacterium]|nr:CinA family protein [Actinomycetota bacterium]
MGQADRLIAELQTLRLTVATAESLTGGMVAATLTAVPGASATVRGGVVSYATDLKESLLGVEPELLAAVGPVDADVAAQMAQGAARLCGADLGLSTTGVAGPDTQNGIAVGTVFVSAAGGRSGFTMTRQLSLRGDRDQIRATTVAAVLDLAEEFLLTSDGNESLT